MKNKFLILLLVCSNQSFFIASDEQAEESENKAIISEPTKKTQAVKTNPKQVLRSERKVFINGRDGQITFIVTDKNNIQHVYTMPIGTKKIIDHVPQHIKKVVCCDKYQDKDIPLSLNNLNTYSVFVFTHDNKVEQYHFIDIKQKTDALNRAKLALRNALVAFDRDKQLIDKLTKKIEDFEDLTIYLQ